MQRVLKIVATALLFIFSLLMQFYVINNINLFGIKPNMLLISIVVVSIYTSIYSCTTYSFLLGLIIDLIFGTSGMFTISYTIIGMILGYIKEEYMSENLVSIIVLSLIGVTIFEVIQYFTNMITMSKFISIFFLIKQVLISLILNIILVLILCFLFGKLIKYIDKKQNKMYW